MIFDLLIQLISIQYYSHQTLEFIKIFCHSLIKLAPNTQKTHNNKKQYNRVWDTTNYKLIHINFFPLDPSIYLKKKKYINDKVTRNKFSPSEQDESSPASYEPNIFILNFICTDGHDLHLYITKIYGSQDVI